MTQHNNLNVNLPNPQLNKPKLVIKNGNAVNLSPNVVSNSNKVTNFPHKLLLTG